MIDAAVEEIVAQMTVEAANGDVPALSALDVTFHEAVCRLSGHRRLLHSWTNMSRQIRLLSHRIVEVQYGGAADLGAGRADVHVGDAAVAAECGQKALRVLDVVREDG